MRGPLADFAPELTMFCRFDVPYDCSVELSPAGYQFFTDIFELYDKVCHVVSIHGFHWPDETTVQDQDGALKSEELDDLFSTSPGCPWVGQGFPDTTISNDTGAVTLQGWLAQWRYAWPSQKSCKYLRLIIA